MSMDLDQLAASLQEKVDEQARKAYGDLKFERWKSPRFGGVMTDASSQGVSPDKGFIIFLKIRDGIIEKASFDTTACGPGIISSDAICELAEGKTLEQAALLDRQDILDLVEGLPSNKLGNADMAVGALRDAIANFQA